MSDVDMYTPQVSVFFLTHDFFVFFFTFCFLCTILLINIQVTGSTNSWYLCCTNVASHTALKHQQITSYESHFKCQWVRIHSPLLSNTCIHYIDKYIYQEVDQYVTRRTQGRNVRG